MGTFLQPGTRLQITMIFDREWREEFRGFSSSPTFSLFCFTGDLFLSEWSGELTGGSYHLLSFLLRDHTLQRSELRGKFYSCRGVSVSSFRGVETGVSFYYHFPHLHFHPRPVDESILGKHHRRRLSSKTICSTLKSSTVRLPCLTRHWETNEILVGEGKPPGLGFDRDLGVGRGRVWYRKIRPPVDCSSSPRAPCVHQRTPPA